MSYQNLPEVARYFKDRQTCVNYLVKMRWNNKPQCVYCGCEKVYSLRGKYKRFKCSECKRHFSVTVGTIFENSPIPLSKWLIAIYLLTAHKKGVSSIQLGKDIGVTTKTAWFMAHRIRYSLKAKSFEKMSGVVQVDEAFVGGKNENRHKDKKVPKSQGRNFEKKTPVIGILNSEGRLYLEAIPNTQGEIIKPIVKRMIEKGSILVSDEWHAYNRLGHLYTRYVVSHAKKQYSKDGYSTNGIENFWSIFKRGIKGIYHGLSKKHLQRYCDEFSFRYNLRKESASERMDSCIRNMNCRLTYKELIGK